MAWQSHGVPYQMIEIGLAFACGLSAGVSIGAVIMTRYWVRRAKTREPVVINRQRFVVLPELAYFDLCRTSREHGR